MKEAIYRGLPHSAFALGTVLLLLATGCAPPTQEADGSAQEAAAVIEEIPITTASDAARQLFDKGQYLLDVGRGVKANETFRAAIAEDPGFVRAHFNQSNTALSFQEFQESLDRASEHLDSASDGERLLVEINRSFLTNDSETGLRLATELAELYPHSPRAAIVLAGLQANQNDNPGARASFARALGLDPSSAAALFGIAGNYLSGEPKEFTVAEEYARKALAAYPDEAKGYELLGDIKRAQNDLDAALDAYNKTSELDPTLGLGHHKRGHVNSFLGNIDDARAAYSTAIEIAPPESKASYAVYRAFTNIHAGDVSAALDELQKVAGEVAEMGTPAAQVKGLQVFALSSAATAAMHAGELDRAAEVVERRNKLVMAIAEDVGTDDARRLQTANCHAWDGLLAAYGGDQEAAARHADKIAELVEGDDNPRKLEPAHWVRGMSALHAGDHVAAVEHLRQANHANSMFVRYQLALAEEGAGNAEEARKLFSEVGAFNFNSIGFALVGRDARQRSST